MIHRAVETIGESPRATKCLNVPPVSADADPVDEESVTTVGQAWRLDTGGCGRVFTPDGAPVQVGYRSHDDAPAALREATPADEMHW